MNKKLVRVLVGSLLALAALGMVGCEFLLEEVFPEYSISGSVINARAASDATDNKVQSPTVVIRDSAGTSVGSVTAGTDGSFTFTDLPPGTYTISATKDDTWAFIPQQVVLLSEAVTGVQVLGFQSDDEYSISLFVVWESTVDIDAYLAFPSAYQGTATPPILNNPYMTAPSNNGYTATYVSGGTEIASSNRFVVGYSGSGGFGDAEQSTTTMAVYGESSSDPIVKRDREVTSGANSPETITLRGVPFDYYSGGNIMPTAYQTTGGTSSGLDTGNYAWLGTADYYIDAFSTAVLATEGQAAATNAIVYVTQGNEVKGRFPIGDFMDLDTLSVLRINMFVMDDASKTEVFQIVPNLRVVKPGFGINSADNQTIVLYGRSRQQ